MNRPQPLLQILRQLQQADSLEKVKVIVDTADGLRHLTWEQIQEALAAQEAPTQTCNCSVQHEQLQEQIQKVSEDLESVAEEVSELFPFYSEEQPFQPDESVFLGIDALKDGAKDRENVAIGVCAGMDLEGTGNVVIGPYAGERSEGEMCDVTALGFMAMRDHTMDVKNTTALGAYSRPTGDHQVVLGDFRTTTYTHSAAHVRGDRRDMVEVEPLEQGLDFVLSVQPITYRNDFREAYIDWNGKPIEPEAPGPEPRPPEIDKGLPEYQPALMVYRAAHAQWKRELTAYDQAMTLYHAELMLWLERNKLSRLKSLGGHAGKRTHLGFDAAELKKICEGLGIDTALIHDHKVNGGDDTLSYAPDMLVPILWRAVQQLWNTIHSDQMVDMIASRLLQRHQDIAAQTQAPAGADLSASE